MTNYEPQKVEKKWQKVWDETGLYKTSQKPKKKFYNLVMFPYPSGNLHIGHWYNFAPADTLARYARMRGHDVLSPIGFDSFGLPAENAAIKRGLKADKWTDQNIADMTEQLKAIGTMYDWDKTLKTSDPEYYRWTQWMFLQLYHAGKAYQKDGLVNWCPNDKTVLANEQVIHGKCDRCDAVVERKNLKQWYFKITDYAERLIKDLDTVEWPERIKQMQRNWIGRSQGARIKFPVDGTEEVLEVFTTRPDTIFGVTYMVVAPEHPLVDVITTEEQRSAVAQYVEKAGSKTDVDRMEAKQKTGVFTGRYAVNPATNEQIPIWVGDYVLMGYGTGAIMAVPAHDERDFEFATTHGLEIRQVIAGKQLPHLENGKLINSAKFDGLSVDDAKSEITAWLGEKHVGHAEVQYRLRDWLISRQRYWGAPIPIIYCDSCGVVPVPVKDLPVVLPLDQEFDKSGRSPLLDHPDYTHVKCPECGKDARRETDTMDTFVDSSWYYLRYVDPSYQDGPFDHKAVSQWLPVDRYIGGAEHAVMHLLYARFFTKFLHDEGHVDFVEPFAKLINQGIILGPDGNKMSKSKGNVVDPDDYVSKYGSDAVRVYLMFMGPYDEGGPWDPNRFEGSYRFIKKIWDMVGGEYEASSIDGVASTELDSRLHKTLARVTDDLENVKFNTAIAALMELVNYAGGIRAAGSVDSAQWQEFRLTLTRMMAPFAPHLSEELWEMLGQTESVHKEDWPAFDPAKLVEESLTIVVQVNGKLRGQFMVARDTERAVVEKQALELAEAQKWTQDREIIKVILVPNKLVNIVTKS